MVTCKNFDVNITNLPRFPDLKILWNWYLHHIDKRNIAKTHLILEIQDWNFVCRPNSDSRTNHVLQLRLSDQPTKFSFFYYPPLRGGGVKKSDFFLLQNFGFWYIRKVKKFRTNIYMRLEATNKNVRGGLNKPPPLPGRVNKNRCAISYLWCVVAGWVRTLNGKFHFFFETVT